MRNFINSFQFYHYPLPISQSAFAINNFEADQVVNPQTIENDPSFDNESSVSISDAADSEYEPSEPSASFSDARESESSMSLCETSSSDPSNYDQDTSQDLSPERNGAAAYRRFWIDR